MTRSEALNRINALVGYKNKELEDSLIGIIDEAYVERKARKLVKKHKNDKPKLHFTSAYQTAASEYQQKLRNNENIEL